MPDWTPARLRQLRRTMGWTQAELAERLGLTRMHVSRMERGAKPITARTARTLDLLTRAM